MYDSSSATAPFNFVLARPLIKSAMSPAILSAAAVAVALGGATASGSPTPPAVLASNPLRGLPALPKPHFSWPFPPDRGYLDNASRAHLQGFLHDYVRVTHSCPLSAASATQAEVATCGAVCKASAPDPSHCIAINYSPWYAKFPGNDPTVTGLPEQAELAYYRGRLDNISAWLVACGAACEGAGVGAVLLDSEKFSVSPDSSPAVRDALTRKCDLVFNATLAAFPHARVEWYNRGSVSRSFTYGWVGPEGLSTGTVDKAWGLFTLRERGASHSLSVYNIRDLFLMRESYRRTVDAATALNTTVEGGRTTGGVTPWLALGCGDVPLATHNCSGHETRYDTPCGGFAFQPPYDAVLSWQLGNEINNLTQYGNSENPSFTPSDAFAPWGEAQVVCLYPSILDDRALPTPNGSTSLVDHLVEYVRGAGGLDGVAGAA